MFKLLTEDTRAKVKREYALRRAVVIVLAILLVLFVTMVGLFPSYILSKARQDEALARTSLSGEGEKPEGEENLVAWLADFNTKLRILSPALDKDRPSLDMERVITDRGAGIQLTSMSWTKVQDGITLTISGTASDRQSLLSFEKRLDSSGHFSDVSLPVSNLARERDISFQMKLVPKKN